MEVFFVVWFGPFTIGSLDVVGVLLRLINQSLSKSVWFTLSWFYQVVFC